VDDLLILGSDREPRPWLRRLTVVAVVIVLAVVVIMHLPHKRETPPHHRAAAASAGPVQLAGLGSGAAGLLNQADGIASQPAPATSPSTPGGRLGPSHHSSGHRAARRCPDATLSYCGTAPCCSLRGT
jgi:hypothetical protein